MTALWLVPAAMLFGALLHLPYGYYMLLRFVVCISAAIIAYQCWPKRAGWSVAFGLVALLFNPLLIVSLHRETWVPIDVAVAVLYVANWFLVERRPKVSGA